MASVFPVSPGWRVLLKDLGLKPADVLRRAGLPQDLFARDRAALTTGEYFGLWRAMEEESADATLPLRVGRAMSAEAFDPPVFAALCSADLNTALSRIARYKRLVMPMALHVNVGPRTTAVELEWLDAPSPPPMALSSTELVFFVQLARIATRTNVTPVEVRSPRPPAPAKPYTDYLGVAVRQGPRARIVFSAADATLPFLTANEAMWRFFEPELQKRLSELDREATTSERVRAALLELLPAGAPSIEAVARRLGCSTRTLQRRLGEEEESFQSLLNRTREELARHYLRTSRMSGAEISFLLGYEDPNSFFRAFHAWTGETPEQARVAMS